jgi:hypothetical protein
MMPSKKPSIIERLETLEEKIKDVDSDENPELESLKERIQDLERTVYGRTDEEFAANQDNDDSVLEEEPKIKGFIIVAPCPSTLKGVDHYYSDEEEGNPWSGNLGDAMVYRQKSKAERIARELWEEEPEQIPFYEDYRKARKKHPLIVKAY